MLGGSQSIWRRRRVPSAVLIAASVCGAFAALAMELHGSTNAAALDRPVATQPSAAFPTVRLSSRTHKMSLLVESGQRPIAASLKDHFRSLRVPAWAHAAAAPTLPAPVATSIASLPGGLNLQAARFVVTSSGAGFWIVPGSGATCLVGSGPPYSGGCHSLTGEGSPDSGGFSQIQGEPGSPETTVTGLVPDGNPFVTVVLADGSEVAAPVVGNVYSVTVGGEPMAIISANASGHRSQHLLPRP